MGFEIGRAEERSERAREAEKPNEPKTRGMVLAFSAHQDQSRAAGLVDQDGVTGRAAHYERPAERERVFRHLDDAG